MQYLIHNLTTDVLRLVMDSGDRTVGASYVIIPRMQKMKIELEKPTKQMEALKKRKLIAFGVVEEPKVVVAEVPPVVQAAPKEEEFPCPECEEVFLTEKKLAKHVKSHETPQAT